MNYFTRREIDVLILIALSFVALLVATQNRIMDPHTFLQKRLLDLSTVQAYDQWAIVPMLLFILPLGIYIVTDKERLDQTNRSE